MPRADANVELVWNKGIARLCDRRFPDEFPDREIYTPNPSYAGALASSKLPDNLIANPENYSNIREGELVWVRVSWLKSFVKQVLPLVSSPFVLLTGDSDSSIPSESMPEARAILNSEKVKHWYAQNYDGTFGSGKISPLPIGIDFHTLSDRAIWGENPSSPRDQEKQLLEIRHSLPPIEDRALKVYVDFAWRTGRGWLSHRRFHPLKGTSFKESRHTVAAKVRKNENVFCQTGPLARSEMWRQRGKYAFVLSPHGVGLDCHRTWESLALGHIVLVPASAIDSVFEGLPVISLKSWKDITAVNLKKWHALGKSSPQIDEKLYSRYWITRLRAG
jgi:hypothetical protein